VTDAATLAASVPPSAGRLLAGPPAYRAHTRWLPGPALLATAGIVAAGMMAMGLVVLAMTVATGGAASEAAEIGQRLWALAAMQAVAVVLTLWVSTGYGGRMRDVLALHGAPGGWRAYAGAVLAIVVFHVLLTTVEHYLLRHDLLTDVRPYVGVVTGAHWPLAVVVMTIGAALAEELLFRGFLLGALAQTRLGFAGAAVITSAAWTALHAGYSWMGLLDVFANGLLLSWLLWRTGSLRVIILCHAFYNGVIVTTLLVAVRWLA
jgi:membrane protease YdiL (CAAX protease family)